METKGLWTKDYEDFIRKDSEERVEQAIREAEGMPEQGIEDLFSFMYEKMPDKLAEQLKEAKGE